MTKRQIGSTPLLILAIIAFVAVASYFLITKNKTLTTPIKQYSAIQSDADLSKASKDLDAEDTNQINIELNRLNSDASAF